MFPKIKEQHNKKNWPEMGDVRQRHSVAVHTGKHHHSGPEGNDAASQGPAFFLATVEVRWPGMDHHIIHCGSCGHWLWSASGAGTFPCFHFSARHETLHMSTGSHAKHGPLSGLQQV